MKPTLLLGCALLAGSALHAQFSLFPNAGFEQSRNSLGYGSGLSAADINGNFKAGLRAGFGLKGGHSPFVGLSTNAAPVSFRFTNPGSLQSNIEAVKGNLQYRLEAGYQYSSKPIQLGKTKSVNAAATSAGNTSSKQKKSCGSYSYRSHCGSKNKAASPVNKTLNMRLQPSLALAYNPSSVQTLKQRADGFEYTAGAWKTALVPAVGFAFAKGAVPLFTLTAFYTRPLGQKDVMASTQLEGKNFVTALQPASSSWGMTIGLPVNFSKAKASQLQKRTEKHSIQKSSNRKCMRWQ
jgi:hypothetical protein